MSPLLTISKLNKHFGGVGATDNLDLELDVGEVHAIIGPNGAGKTTLISQLCGALLPDSGNIVFDGINITNFPAHKRAKLGITRSFQITSLVMDMSVLENVALAVQARSGHSFRFIKPVKDQTDIQSGAMDALERVGLKPRCNESTRNLSHGEQRQLEIAVALATNAKLMLLDEPMAGLGIEESMTMISFLKTLKGERTILLVEHDMDAVFALADRISVLVYGRIIATGSPAQIRSNTLVRDAYLGGE